MIFYKGYVRQHKGQNVKEVSKHTPTREVNLECQNVNRNTPLFPRRDWGKDADPKCCLQLAFDLLFDATKSRQTAVSHYRALARVVAGWPEERFEICREHITNWLAKQEGGKAA